MPISAPVMQNTFLRLCISIIGKDIKSWIQGIMITDSFCYDKGSIRHTVIIYIEQSSGGVQGKVFQSDSLQDGEVKGLKLLFQ